MLHLVLTRIKHREKMNKDELYDQTATFFLWYSTSKDYIIFIPIRQVITLLSNNHLI